MTIVFWLGALNLITLVAWLKARADANDWRRIAKMGWDEEVRRQEPKPSPPKIRSSKDYTVN